jgi:hypothetical protein
MVLKGGYGGFGIIQTGVLNSIAARNYAFETFRHRTNLMYFHDIRGGGRDVQYYKSYHTRAHAIASDRRGSSDTSSIATTRPIGFGMNPETEGSGQDHNDNSGKSGGIFSIQENVRNESVAVAPVWIRPVYGICLDARCER